MAVQPQPAAQSGVARMKRFLREVKVELKKVSWPGKKELVAYTGIVLVSVVAVAIAVWAIDSALSAGLKVLTK